MQANPVGKLHHLVLEKFLAQMRAREPDGGKILVSEPSGTESAWTARWLDGVANGKRP